MSLILGECHTASPDMCRLLHASTGWDGTHLKWNIGRRRTFAIAGYTRGNPNYRRNGEPEDFCELSLTYDTAGSAGVIEVDVVPAYDLGYLMRRAPLPVSLTHTDDRWVASLPGRRSVEASSPEDAVAMVCAAETTAA